MRTYVAFLVSTGLTVAALASVIVVHGGWEAAAAGLGMVASLACLFSLIALLSKGERPGPRGPGAWAV